MATSLREQAAVLALVRASTKEWYRPADVIADTGSAVRLLDGDLAPMSVAQRAYADQLVGRVSPDDVEQAHALIERVAAQGIRLITVLDEEFSLNLQLIYNRPPFIRVRGRLEPANMRVIAVVGTRQASAEGRATAARLARELSDAGVTVISGLARGIDTAAHTAALDASGRTVAVIWA